MTEVAFETTSIPGAYVVRCTPFRDERGAFFRVFSASEFQKMGLCLSWRQISRSQNRAAGTLRGLHIQTPPHEETKLAYCERGRLFDVIVDLRPHSPRFGAAFTIELSEGDGAAVYVPHGVAHGFMTLEDDSTIGYMISADYSQPHSTGVRWDDPGAAVDWPMPPRVQSARDLALPTVAAFPTELFSETPLDVDAAETRGDVS